MSFHDWLWRVGTGVGLAAGVLTLRRRNACTAATVSALVLAVPGFFVGAKWQYRLEYLPLRDAITLAKADFEVPGFRLPLGFLVGGLLAILWCAVVRAPWRSVGDALAVAAAAMCSIGRVACYVSGCRMGSVCATRVAAFCPRYPPGTEAYNQQLRDGLITLASPLSLPAHPLPVYFGFLSVLTLGGLVWMLRGGASPGSLLLASCLVGPLGRLAVEWLRVDPPAANLELMTLVPKVTLLVALLYGLALTWARGRARTGRHDPSALPPRRHGLGRSGARPVR